MMTDDSTDVSKYGSVIGGSDLGKEDQSSDQFDFESVGDSVATENETADGDSDNHTSSSHPVVKVKTLVEYHLEFLTKHPGEVFFYGCKLCTNRFTSRNSFLIHMKLHNVRKRYPCPHCDKAYDRKFQLVHHLRLHTEETPFECGVCFVAYATEPQLVEHSKVHRSDKPFECRFCLKGFPQKKALIVHLRMHTGERPFPCTLCDRTFTQKAHLQGHMVRIHIPKNKVEYAKSTESQAVADKPVLHSIFSKSESVENFGSANNSESNAESMPSEIDLSILSGQREKLIECDFCDKKFTYERNKTNHMKKHGFGDMGSSHHECGLCQRIFPTRGLLMAHVMTHSSNSNVGNSNIMNSNIVANFGNAAINNFSSPFRCDICGREFNMKRNLIMHVKSHNNERPFECPACEKSFKLKYFLELHVTRIHPHIKIEDLGKKKEIPVTVSAEKENAALNLTSIPITPNKRKQSQPKKVIMRTDEYETDSDSSYGEYSSESDKEMQVDSEPFDAAKFVQVYVQQQPKNLIVKKEDSSVAKSMQINLPHDLQHVKSLLNSKAPIALSEPKPISCPLCSIIVANKAALTLHIKEHEKNKPHQCTMCEKVYIQQASFEKHLKKHMLDDLVARQTKMIEQATMSMKTEQFDPPVGRVEGRKPLECSICKKKYAQPASFEKHMRQHSEMGETAKAERMSFDNNVFEKLEGMKNKQTTGQNSNVPNEGAFINPSDFLEVSIEH